MRGVALHGLGVLLAQRGEQRRDFATTRLADSSGTCAGEQMSGGFIERETLPIAADLREVQLHTPRVGFRQ